MAEFVGTYVFEKDDGNFNECLKAMDVGLVTRKMACNLTPTIKISTKDDGTIVVETCTTFKDSKIEFKLGEEFDEKRMDGVSVKTVITRDGNKLIQEQKSEVPVYITREFTDGKLITTCKCKEVVCVREYKKQ